MPPPAHLAAAPDRVTLEGRVVVVIPAFNEAESIGEVLAAIPKLVHGIPTVALVVDDGSDDGTAGHALKAGAQVVRQGSNRGGGAALRTGYRLACAGGAKVVATLDADGQHLPEELPVVVGPILAGEADLVTGSRVLGSAQPGVFARRLGIAVFNRLVSLLTRRGVSDCSNSFRAIHPAALAQLDLRQDQFHAAELLIEAITRRLIVEEVPVSVVGRAHGHSKKPGSFRYGFGFANAILSAWLRAMRRRVGPTRQSVRTQPAAAPTGGGNQFG